MEDLVVLQLFLLAADVDLIVPVDEFDIAEVRLLELAANPLLVELQSRSRVRFVFAKLEDRPAQEVSRQYTECDVLGREVYISLSVAHTRFAIVREEADQVQKPLAHFASHILVLCRHLEKQVEEVAERVVDRVAH